MIKKILFVFLNFLFVLLVGCSSEKNSSLTNNEEKMINIEKISDKVDDKLVNNKKSDNIIDNITVNEIESEATKYLFANSISMFDPGEENFKEMTRENVLKYFGMELDISSILPNLYEDTDRYGFYKFNDGNIFDQHIFTYRSNQEQELRMIICKNKLPMSSIVEVYDHEIKNSKVLDNDVIIAHYINSDEKDMYYTEFIVHNLGVMMIAEDITIEDFMDILEYIIQGKR